MIKTQKEKETMINFLKLFLSIVLLILSAAYLDCIGKSFVSVIVTSLAVGFLIVLITGLGMQEHYLEVFSNKKLREVKTVLKDEIVSENDAAWAVGMLEQLDKDQHAESRCYLGELYFCGKHVKKKDLEEAFSLFKRAAKQDNAEAQYNLSLMYREGKYNISKDLEKADMWEKKAKENGYGKESFFEKAKKCIKCSCKNCG